jgi:hypothetical protein
LDTEKDFEIYTMLYGALTDEDFEMPEEQEYENLIMNFLETYPKIPIVSSKQIMSVLNDKDNKDDHAMFKEDETGDDGDDTLDDDQDNVRPHGRRNNNFE